VPLLLGASKQPHILDRDHGLFRAKVLTSSICLSVERVGCDRVSAIRDERTLAHRGMAGMVRNPRQALWPRSKYIPDRQDIGNMDHVSFEYDTTGQCAAPRAIGWSLMNCRNCSEKP